MTNDPWSEGIRIIHRLAGNAAGFQAGFAAHQLTTVDAIFSLGTPCPDIISTTGPIASENCRNFAFLIITEATDFALARGPWLNAIPFK
jgi:hypothetical protein